MLHSKRSSFTGSSRKVSPPTPTNFTEQQKASYLASLRNDRPTRPTGSRPSPFKSGSHVSSMRAAFDRSDSAPVPVLHNTSEHPGMVKASSFSSSSPTKGRPLAHAPQSSISSVRSRNVSPPTSLRSQASAEAEYQESTRRRLEREESHTLREALELIDGRDEEAAIYSAAQQEAADLVWKHRNPQAAEDEKTAPYFNPDVQKRKSYGNDLGSKSRGVGRNVSDSSTGSSESSTSARASRRHDRALSQALKDLHIASEERAAIIMSTSSKNRRRSSGQRIASNGSSKGVFRNPDDQIYEEPQAMDSHRQEPPMAEPPLRTRAGNSILRGARPLPPKPGVTFAPDQPKFNRVDIYKNPPSQSRNAGYTANPNQAKPSPPPAEDTPKSTDGIEIRGDDIRAATSMKLKDRSAKLPTPVAVSDHVGRPIVSFDPAWKPPSDSPRSSMDTGRPVIKLTESPRTSKDIERPLPRPLPSKHQTISSAPVVPTIHLPGDGDDDGLPSIKVDPVDAPAINVSPPLINVSGPSINVSEPSDTAPKPKPVSRPLPKHAATTPAPANSPLSKRLPWLRSGAPAAAAIACSSCELPISGRVVTASGSSSGSLKARLHPECFSCYHCQTNLECVAFFPEPDVHRQNRLEAEGLEETDEGDIRFFCSLDYHELFSPRCKSCKTPIEGEVIVAAGAEWHVGHFFCAECGDPFDSNTPFVEKDGYAYCVRCHTRRTSARCRECKQQILDELTVEALGGKWHEECFRCYECQGSFGDEGRFFIRDVAVEPSDKERRKGITRKMEEKAVCSGCEERRLKA